MNILVLDTTFFVLCETKTYLFNLALHFVGISWWEVSQNLGSIQTFPEKCVVLWEREDKILTIQFWGLKKERERESAYGKGVNQVPAELLCQEIGNATALHYLRQLSRVAKRVRKPELKRTRKDNYSIHM